MQGDRITLLTKREIKFWICYAIAGIVFAVLFNTFFSIPITSTIRGYYGFVYMFYIPGFLLLRAIKPNKKYEEFAYIGYPSGITFAIVMLCILILVNIRTPITLFKIFLPLTLISVASIIYFYYKKGK